MKYSCNACGAYVEAGGGHSCYSPSHEPQTEVERLRSLNECYRHDLALGYDHIETLEAQTKTDTAFIHLVVAERDKLRAENKALRKAAKAVMKGCTRCWGKITYSGRDFEPCICSYCQTLSAALTQGEL